MENADFQRVAPRYLDKEVSSGERRAFERHLMEHPGSQETLELLELEAECIRRAFLRPREDISTCVIRARRRNPHRRATMPSLLAIGVQIAMLGGLVVVLLYLAAKLAPPTTALVDVDGNLIEKFEGAIDIGQPLPVGPVLYTDPRGQARVAIGQADLVSANENSAFILRSPTSQARHVVELSYGELWCHFSDNQYQFRVQFEADILQGIAISGRNAEVNIVAGRSLVHELLPRSYDIGRRGTPNALIRVIEGQVDLRRTDAVSTKLEPGKAYVVINATSEVEVVDDPDARYYPILRRDTEGNFKQYWNWLHPEELPLSLPVVTYPIWKRLAAVVERIDAIRRTTESELQRENIDQLITSLRQRLVQAGLDASIGGQPQDVVTDPALLASITLDEVREKGRRWHSATQMSGEEDRRDLLAQLTPDINAILDAWQMGGGDSSMLPLYDSRRIKDASKVLAHFAQERQARLARAATREASLTATLKVMGEARTQAKEAQDKVDAFTTNQNLDLSGERSTELATQINALTKRLEEVEAMRDERDLLALQLAPLEDAARAAATALRRAESKAEEATTARDAAEALLRASSFDAAALSVAQEASALATTRLASEEQSQRTLEEAHQKLVASRNGMQESLASSTQSVVTLQQRIEATAATLASLSGETIPGAQRSLTQAAEATRLARMALARLPENQREGSEAAKALADAVQREDSARENLAQLRIQEAQAQAQLSADRKLQDDARSEGARLRREIESTNSSIAELEGQIGARKQKIDELTQAIERHGAVITRQLQLQEERNELEGRATMARQEHTTATEALAQARARHTSADVKLAPVNARFREVDQLYSTRDDIKRERDSLQSQQRRLEATSRQYATQQQNLINALRRVLSDQMLVLDGQRTLALELGSGEAVGAVSHWEAVRLLREESDRLNARFKATESPETAGEQSLVMLSSEARELVSLIHDVIVEMDASIAKNSEFCRTLLLNWQHQRLGLAWMACVATELQEGVAARETRLYAEFQQQRTALSGFGLPGEEIEEAIPESSLYHTLQEHANSADHRVFDGLDGDVEGRLKPLLSSILDQQWKLFAPDVRAGDGDVASASAPDAKVSYYASMALKDSGRSVRDINVSWSTWLQQALRKQVMLPEATAEDFARLLEHLRARH